MGVYKNSLEKRYYLTSATLNPMFRRKIYDEITAWKNLQSTHHQALVIKELRQMGKTHIATRFAEDNNENIIADAFSKMDRKLYYRAKIRDWKWIS